MNWHVALRPGKRAALDKGTRLGAMINEVERIKASIRAQVEHSFRVIKRQFGFVKVRSRPFFGRIAFCDMPRRLVNNNFGAIGFVRVVRAA